MIEVGTRIRAAALHIAPQQGSLNAGTTRDVELAPDVTASVTFGGGEAAAANGTFAGFAANELVFVQGSNLNDGYFTVTSVDLTNHAYLVLSPLPKAEGPVSVRIRTA